MIFFKRLPFRYPIYGQSTVELRFTDIKERNSRIVKAYKEGYSQQMMAKVLEMAQSTISGIVKRYG